MVGGLFVGVRVARRIADGRHCGGGREGQTVPGLRRACPGGIVSRALTEEQWRDVSARWSEMRPEHLDWKVHTEIHARGTIDVREDWERAMNVRMDTLRPARHVAVIELQGSTESELSYSPNDLPPMRTIATWEVESTLLGELLECLVEMFSDERLMLMVKRRGPLWEDSVQQWVWERFHERGRGR